MKTVIIHGQNHKGSSYNIGRALANKVATEDEITEFFLPKDLNHFCLVGKEQTKIWMKKKLRRMYIRLRNGISSL